MIWEWEAALIINITGCYLGAFAFRTQHKQRGGQSNLNDAPFRELNPRLDLLSVREEQ